MISGGTTTLTPAPEISAALSALGVTLTPTGSAAQTTNGFGFPVTGGKVNAKTFAGTVQHTGSGFTASKGAASLTLSDFAINIDATPSLSALVAGTRGPSCSRLTRRVIRSARRRAGSSARTSARR